MHRIGRQQPVDLARVDDLRLDGGLPILAQTSECVLGGEDADDLAPADCANASAAACRP